MVLLSQRAVVDIWDQPPQITYRNQVGKLSSHTFDFLITLEDRKKIAIAVKPGVLAERNGFDREFALIKTQIAKQFADDALLVTDGSFSAAEVRNAELLHMFRQAEDVEADVAIQQILRGMNCETSLGQVVAATGLQGRAFRAGFKAIFDGLVLTDLSLPVTEASVLSNSEVP
ncbi:TnsA endonuclease N-terminal domain-containing protein [Paracoccus sp. R86501]|uniref:TnsA endonuclease N-terminal domain-containing protein n=1 Tax=Paracoccus sp. R86501 TaxID=3101711 RepID=UPI00366D3BAD